MLKDCPRYEPVAWWFTRARLGRALRGRYEVPAELPAELLTLVRKLDAIEGDQLLRREDANGSSISVQEVISGSARSVAELDAPAPNR
jgi:hypothetical protein